MTAAPPPAPANPWLKLAVEFGPLLVFFLANWKAGIFAATAAFMAAMAVAIAYTFATTRKVPPILWVNGAVVGVFGGLTLALEDALFIKLKPTIVNLLFAGALGVGLVFDRPFLKMLFGPAFPPLTDAGWRRLTINWALFFCVLAGLNEVVWRNFSTDFWVGFKVWGIMPLTLVFALSQVPVMLKHQAGDPQGGR
ncbi:MAG: septation protein A [Pseudomonadota bacterium]